MGVDELVWFLWIIYFIILVLVFSVLAWIVNQIWIVIQKDNDKYKKEKEEEKDE